MDLFLYTIESNINSENQKEEERQMQEVQDNLNKLKLFFDCDQKEEKLVQLYQSSMRRVFDKINDNLFSMIKFVKTLFIIINSF